MISIIIPIYNAEKYIEECINSVLNQTYKNWELILVNDGSTDQSYELCLKYAETNTQIIIIQQENKGANKAREEGWKLAKGEWITFVDADDSLPCDALEYLASAIDEKTDIILGWLNNFKFTSDRILSIEEYRSRNIRRGGIHVGPVAHLYRKKIFSNETFDIPRNIIMGEDMLMNIRLSFNTENNVKIVNKVVYNYYIENPTNTTSSFKLNLDYEELLHKYRLLSIPDKFHQKYMNEMIEIRLYTLIQYITQNPFENKWKKSTFFIELINDINNNNFKTNISTYLLLNTKSSLLRYILIKYRLIIKYYLFLKSYLHLKK